MANGSSLKEISVVMDAALPPFRRMHEIDGEHYHDDDAWAQDYDPRSHALWQSDVVELISVGIDVGSSGTQIIFSRIHMQRMGDHLSSRYFVALREQLYQSPVAFTPYAQGLTIDKDALSAIIADAYRAADVEPVDIDTGAVILTGEALRRENAQAVADILAERSGDFVCTMAGHHIEAQLAAYGSGAAWLSNQDNKRILNIDIGGGTTKYAVVERGRVIQSAALHVGGRLHVFDGDSLLVRQEPVGKQMASQIGAAWRLGAAASDAEKDRLADRMAQYIIQGASAETDDPGLQRLMLTDPLTFVGPIDGVMFSGGVSEYIYGREARDFGDMGPRLGARLAAMGQAGKLPWPMLPAGTGIRATALGLSEYSFQLSGNTIYISDPQQVLPRRNLRVVQPDIPLPDDIDSHAVARTILERSKYESGDETLAYAFRWAGPPSYRRISAFARGLALALADRAEGPNPIYIVLDGDIARTLGQILHDELHVTAPLLIIDGILLSEFEFVDFGRVRLPSNTVPITIKSLLFSKDPRDPQALRRE